MMVEGNRGHYLNVVPYLGKILICGLRREGGEGGQILDFGYLCAQFYCPLCDGSKNLQF